MNKKTAVEWLLENITIGSVAQYKGLNIDSVIEQAKQMEKEQISKAWDDGDHAYFYSKKDGSDFENGEQYYNETYGKENTR